MQSDIREERLVVLQVLDHERTRAELERELDDFDSETITRALAALERAGVVVIDGLRVRASESLRRLDMLGLIAV
jgi:DNA-binding HxlR family transcriptional regulator